MLRIDDYLNSDLRLIPVVVCFAVKGNNVLLGLRKKVSTGLGLNIIAGLGGKVGDSPEIFGESNEQALYREMAEETTIHITHFNEVGRVRFIYPHKPKWSLDGKIYICTKWVGEPTETETTKPLWFPINNMPWEQMWPDNKFWVPNILNGENIDIIFLFDEHERIVEMRV